MKRDLIAESGAMATQLQHWKHNPAGASSRGWAEAVENMRDAADLLGLLADELVLVRALANEHRRSHEQSHRVGFQEGHKQGMQDRGNPS
jgi:hypothetical protein